jgi:hypothetical protein
MSETQRTFRNAVLTRLSRTETMVGLLLGQQIVEGQQGYSRSEDQIKEHSEAAEN